MAGERRDFSKSLYEVVGYSALNYAAFAWLIIPLHADFHLAARDPTLFHPSAFLVIFVAPIVWPILLVGLTRFPPLTKLGLRHPVQTPWDFVFGRAPSYWVIVRLKGGELVGGRFAEKSFATSSPHEPQIYLQEAWSIRPERTFAEKIHATRGILVTGSEISTIEFFEGQTSRAEGS